METFVHQFQKIAESSDEYEEQIALQNTKIVINIIIIFV